MICKFDHNGECVVCDCSFEYCAYDRWVNKDYTYETEEELDKMFKKSVRGIKEETTKLPIAGEVFIDTESIYFDMFASEAKKRRKMKPIVREHNRKQIESLQQSKKLFKS